MEIDDYRSRLQQGLSELTPDTARAATQQIAVLNT
jgi:hypothetical protein